MKSTSAVSSIRIIANRRESVKEAYQIDKCAVSMYNIRDK